MMMFSRITHSTMKTNFVESTSPLGRIALNPAGCRSSLWRVIEWTLLLKIYLLDQTDHHCHHIQPRPMKTLRS